MSAATGPAAVIRAAAILCWAPAAGFGLGALFTAWYLHAHGRLPRMLGFRAFGGGFFERLGTTAFTLLLAAFLVVCTGEAAAGWLLWHGRAGGALLALALLPAGAVCWLGFALPIPPVLALARTGLIVSNWAAAAARMKGNP